MVEVMTTEEPLHCNKLMTYYSDNLDFLFVPEWWCKRSNYTAETQNILQKRDRTINSNSPSYMECYCKSSTTFCFIYSIWRTKKIYMPTLSIRIKAQKCLEIFYITLSLSIGRWFTTQLRAVIKCTM